MALARVFAVGGGLGGSALLLRHRLEYDRGFGVGDDHSDDGLVGADAGPIPGLGGGLAGSDIALDGRGDVAEVAVDLVDLGDGLGRAALDRPAEPPQLVDRRLGRLVGAVALSPDGSGVDVVHVGGLAVAQPASAAHELVGGGGAHGRA